MMCHCPSLKPRDTLYFGRPHVSGICYLDAQGRLWEAAGSSETSGVQNFASHTAIFLITPVLTTSNIGT